MRVACVLTGHVLKDPDATINYHSKKQGPFANPPDQYPQKVWNELHRQGKLRNSSHDLYELAKNP